MYGTFSVLARRPAFKGERLHLDTRKGSERSSEVGMHEHACLVELCTIRNATKVLLPLMQEGRAPFKFLQSRKLELEQQVR